MVERRKTKRQWPALLFCLVLSLACLALALLPIKRGSAESIPVPLHSELTANYNADPPSTPIPEIQLDIIKDVIHSEAASDVSERLSNLENTLKTPVPMITPLPTSVIIVTFIPPPQPSLVATLPLPTLTVPLPTPTLRPTKKPKPTHDLPLITRTPKPTHDLPLITKTPKPKKKPTHTAPSSTSTPQPGQPTATLPWLPTISPTHKIKLPKSTATLPFSTPAVSLSTTTSPLSTVTSPFSTPALPLSTPLLLPSTPTLFQTPIIILP